MTEVNKGEFPSTLLLALCVAAELAQHNPSESMALCIEEIFRRAEAKHGKEVYILPVYGQMIKDFREEKCA